MTTNTKNMINFDDDVTTGEDCVLYLGVSGDKEYIRKVLQDAIKEIDASYGKPVQGIVSQYGGTKHVITPRWNGGNY